MSTTHTTTVRKPAAPASEAQVTFIKDLLATRDVPAALRTAIDSAVAMPSVTASVIITTLMALPKTPAVVAAAPAGPPVALYQMPLGRYAVPTLELPDLGLVRDKQDMMFFRVSEYRGRRRLVRLSGAPGYFNAFRVSLGMTAQIATHINKDALRYTQLFAQHFSVCGRCLAELTDVDSRAAGLGPTCRKAFGLNY